MTPNLRKRTFVLVVIWILSFLCPQIYSQRTFTLVQAWRNVLGLYFGQGFETTGTCPSSPLVRPGLISGKLDSLIFCQMSPNLRQKHLYISGIKDSLIFVANVPKFTAPCTIKSKTNHPLSK